MSLGARLFGNKALEKVPLVPIVLGVFEGFTKLLFEALDFNFLLL
jgi:hypothetical protein